MAITWSATTLKGYTLKGAGVIAPFSYNAPYTFMAWIYVTSNAANQSLFSVSDNATDTVSFGSGKAAHNRDMLVLLPVSGSTTQMNIRYILSVNDNASTLVRTAALKNIPLNEWHHVALTILSSGLVWMYVDGEIANVSTSRSVAARTAAAQRIDIGREATAYGGPVGRMAHIKMWTRSLSQAEIREEMQVSAPMNPDSIFAWYPARENAGTLRTLDYSGRNEHLALSAIGSNPGPVDGPNPPDVDTFPNPLPSPTANVTFNGTIRRDLAMLLDGVLSFVGDLKRGLTQNLWGELDFSGSVKRLIMIRLLAILSFSHNLNIKRSAVVAVGGALTFAGTVRRSMAKRLTGALGFTGGATSLAKRIQTIVGQLSFAHQLRRRSALNVGGQLSFAHQLKRSLTKRLAGSLHFGSVVTTGRRVMISAELWFNGMVTKSLLKRLIGSLGFNGTAKGLLSRIVNLGGILRFTGTGKRSVVKVLEGSLTFTHSLVKGIKLRLTGVLTFSGTNGLVRKGLLSIPL